ncbi:Peroxidasin homolog pxn-1 [Caenorhabditis elegans]|uniref:Peroxidasin homolog pxn-1 n=1 Tax=Caenorhabditis elegans TaxID=6239 RepID=PXDN1_CAEEL|nr:Peroxidasin homolog pxn-1 [Caenorhabditis elegans]Q1ENI8.1 RecName: Full=Peroxidasin homolog pxn-1; Flags: Precursor [Caenorhabditis elegans]CCD71290.1 Peroxidasin homolog pxn-1 [Caenorhabditis elegans]|eukprot:NP_505188.3 Peroxidasin homolog [Caenorhabditis elegans]
MNLYLLLLVIATSSWQFVAGLECPVECTCDKKGLVVDCSSSGLTRIPKNISRNVRSLVIRNNRIHKLKRSDLEGFNQLETLVLTHNKIKIIEENVLDHLPELKRLSLAHNELVYIPPLCSDSRPLASLNLKRNHIQFIDEQVLRYFPDLTQLDFSHNRIQSLRTKLFDNLPALSHAHLHSNPWHCDCRASKVKALLQKVKWEKKVYCTNPVELRHQALDEVDDSALTCARPAEESWTGEEIKLTCAKNSSSKLVVWMYENVEVDSSSLDGYEIHDTVITVPRKTNVNFMTCTYDFDHIPHHRRLRQSQHQGNGSPQFTYKPRDNSFREGSEVKVNCEVMGNPKPTINWYHNGKRFISSRKRQLGLSNNVLRIYPFLEEDSGRYTCEAVNSVGKVRHAFSLDLISSVPPNIYEGPQSVSQNLGGSVVFVCKANGNPVPDYTWSFDGSTIGHIKGRFMVSDDGTELRISNIEKKDEGYYSCMAGNPVGAMSADAKLTVIGGETRKAAAPQIDEELLRAIAQKARQNVENAVEKTRKQLTQDKVTNTNDLKRLFRFSTPKQAVELSKAREIYEESVRLVREHVEKGLILNVDELHPKNVSYESVLHVTHVQALMGLSGCHTGQYKNPCTDTCFHHRYRSFDGQCNNKNKPMTGVSLMPLRRLLKPVYENGFNTPVGWEKGRLYNGYPLPNVREVSRQLVATENITPHSKLSSMVMQWGQFVDHDLTHTVTALSRHSYATGAFCNRTCENLDPCFNIPLSPNDPRVKSGSAKYPCIEFERSAAVCGSGETSLVFNRVTYREQMNALTSFLDASNVYGSNEVQAQELRDTYNNNGMLRFDITSEAGKEYLPFEKDSNMDCRRNFSEENPIRCFLAGDLRANEQLALAATHTIFIREHNRIAKKLKSMNGNWDGEIIYHETRKIVGAMMQHITYKHWMPIIFGGQAQMNKFVGTYQGYDPDVDASVTNAFATAAFRFGHTIINPSLFRLGNDFMPIKEGHIALHKAFFTPELVLTQGGVDPLLRGLFASPLKHPMPTQLLNMELIEKLFMKGHEVSLDLAVMNIQRSRDHGLPSYTEYRKFCNLPVPVQWEDMKGYIKDDMIIQKLRGLYGVPQNIDLWVGGIVEEKLENGLFGPTFACIIGEQFRKIRDGDRFWYEKDGVFTPEQLREIKKITLARLFCDNGDNIDRIQKDVFMYPGMDKENYGTCQETEMMNLRAWSKCCDNVCPTMLDRILRSRHRGSRLHGCNQNGIWRPEGAKWIPQNEICTECVCQGSRVWCSTKEDCSDNRSPF